MALRQVPPPPPATGAAQGPPRPSQAHHNPGTPGGVAACIPPPYGCGVLSSGCHIEQRRHQQQHQACRAWAHRNCTKTVQAKAPPMRHSRGGIVSPPVAKRLRSSREAPCTHWLSRTYVFVHPATKDSCHGSGPSCSHPLQRRPHLGQVPAYTHSSSHPSISAHPHVGHLCTPRPHATSAPQLHHVPPTTTTTTTSSSNGPEML
jgi:hypothetical protein